MAAVNTHSAILQYQGPEDGGGGGGVQGRDPSPGGTGQDGTGRDGTTASSHLDSFTVFPLKCFFEKREIKNIYLCTENGKRDCFTKKNKKKHTHSCKVCTKKSTKK